MTIVLFSLGVAGGFALCWFAKDKLLLAINGAESLIKALETKAAALKVGR